MSTLAVILENCSGVDALYRTKMVNQILCLADKILLVYIKQDAMSFFNIPCALGDTTETVLQRKKVEREYILTALSDIEADIKGSTRIKNVVKVVLLGNEKYKIRSFLQDFGVDFVAVVDAGKKSLCSKILNVGISDFISNTCKLPVLILQNK